jgi:hypothetical protein
MLESPAYRVCVGRSGLLSQDQMPAMASRSVVEILLELTMSFCYRCLEEVSMALARTMYALEFSTPQCSVISVVGLH